MDNKELFFAGLPDSLFTQILAFLQATATCPGTGAAGPEVAGALAALVSLAQSEHAAAASTVQVRPIDAVFRAIEIKEEFELVQAAGAGGPLVLALANLKAKLDKLTDFWYGK